MKLLYFFSPIVPFTVIFGKQLVVFFLVISFPGCACFAEPSTGCAGSGIVERNFADSSHCHWDQL